MTTERTMRGLAPELSLVIPVYNGSQTISLVVERIHTVFASMQFDVILVNDGSEDDSEVVCAKLVEKFPHIVTLVQLSRNFGEHNAVLAGLSHARGQYIAVLDDDGQNPPEEVVPMLEELKRRDYDVIYGHYIKKKHSWFRNAGSWFNDRIATFILDKPKNLYLSSFKVMTRFVVDEIIRYRGPFPYIDGLIYRTSPEDWSDTSPTSRQYQRSLALFVSKTGKVVAKHVFEFFHRAVTVVGLRRAIHILFECLGAGLDLDR